MAAAPSPSPPLPAAAPSPSRRGRLGRVVLAVDQLEESPPTQATPPELSTRDTIDTIDTPSLSAPRRLTPE
ncbi:hypothetical protein GCM10029964_036230 [Kibdelosporangium lantanae]